MLHRNNSRTVSTLIHTQADSTEEIHSSYYVDCNWRNQLIYKKAGTHNSPTNGHRVRQLGQLQPFKLAAERVLYLSTFTLNCMVNVPAGAKVRPAAAVEQDTAWPTAAKVDVPVPPTGTQVPATGAAW